MNENLNLKRLAAFASMLLFALIISGCGPSATNTANTNTGSTRTNANAVATNLACDDAQVIKDMIATIDAKYPLLKSRMDHLSAYSKGCTVSLMGYTDTLQNFKDFYNVAADTPNVVKVNIDKLFIDSADVTKPSAGQCPVGQQACGDICVPQGQCWTKSKPEGNTNANMDANSYANKNAASKP